MLRTEMRCPHPGLRFVRALGFRHENDLFGRYDGFRAFVSREKIVLEHVPPDTPGLLGHVPAPVPSLKHEQLGPDPLFTKATYPANVPRLAGYDVLRGLDVVPQTPLRVDGDVDVTHDRGSPRVNQADDVPCVHAGTTTGEASRINLLV